MLLVAQRVGAAREADLAEFRRHRPEITMKLDLRIPGTDGNRTLIASRGEVSPRSIILLQPQDGDGDIQRRIRAGDSA